MRKGQRNFLLSMISAIALLSPGFAGAASPTPSVADFAGMWSHPWIPGYEPMASGPTSLTNLSRRRGVANPLQLVGDYNNPILKPDAAATVKRLGEMSRDHYGYPTPRNQCWPNGVPFVLATDGMEVFQRGDTITFIYQIDHQVRHARMNGVHPAKVTPTWYGDSVAHWEGDTLVIDTIGIKPGPFAMVDSYGTPQTPALHVVERYRLLDYAAARDGLDRASKENTLPPNPLMIDLDYRGKHLQVQFTVEDPNVFTTPWTATVTYGRPSGEWVENICGENPHKYGTEEDARLPTAEKPDF